VPALRTARRSARIIWPKSSSLTFEFNGGKYIESSLFCGAYGIGAAFYLDNGTVKYGPSQAAYKDYLTQLRAWYDEELLDPDAFSQDNVAMDTKVTSNMAGSWGAQVGGGLGTYLDAMKGTDFDVVGAVFPSLVKGQPAEFMRLNYRVNAQYATITTQCDVIDAALKLYDFNYGDGHMLMNFGIEGDSYKMVDGVPTYTEKITNPTDGSTMGFALSQYVRSHWYIPGFQDSQASIQFNERYPQQVQAKDEWMKSAEAYTTKHQLPNVTLLPEESEEIAGYINEVTTYVMEMTSKFIIGTESLDNFDAFVQQQKTLGLDKILAAYSAALTRYNARGK
jgi:putative aldouronate transport system substrate-binding protein